MALIDKETICTEIERLCKCECAEICRKMDLGFDVEPCREYALSIYQGLLHFIDTLPEHPKDDKEQIVNLPKWQKLKNINSYSDRKTWKDDKVLFVADSEGYLYACSIRELFDKLPKEE